MGKAFKRGISLVIAVLLLCSSIVACKNGGKENETTTKADEAITLKVYGELTSFWGEQEGWGAKLLLDKFNVKLQYITNGENSFEEGMESEDFADIIIFGGRSNYEKAVLAGKLYDWNEEGLLVNFGPYIYENMQTALNRNREITSEITDGTSNTLFGIGHNVASSLNDVDGYFYTWDIRWDLYKQLGYPTIKNLEDLTQVLLDMKELCPTDDAGNETYGVSLWSDWDKDSDMVMYVKSLVTAYYGYDGFAMGHYDSENGEYYDALKADGPYLDCLKFFNNLYRKGLLDPESSTQTYDDYYKKLNNGNVLWSIFNYAGSMGYNETHMEDNKIMCSLVPKEATPGVYGLSVEGGNRFWTICADTKYPELCMEIINWLATPEGVMTYNYGPKGLCWNYDEEGYTYFTEFGRKAFLDRSVEMEGQYVGTGTFNEGFLQINNTIWNIQSSNPDSNGETYLSESWKSEQPEPQCDMEADWRNQSGATSVREYLEGIDNSIIPASSFVVGEKDSELEKAWENVTTVIKEYSWNAIYAKSDGEYNQIVSEMNAKAKEAGYDQCIEWAAGQAQSRFEEEAKLRN